MEREDGWAPVAEAAAECGLPLRTLYNWLKSRRLESKTSAGVTLVAVEAVRAEARQRANGDLGPKESPVAGNGAGNGIGKSASNLASAGPPQAATRPPPLDGDLASQLFSAFERGESPSALVQKLRVAPQAALAAWRQWEELRDVAGTSMAGRADLDELVQTVAGLAARLDEFTVNGQLSGQVYVLRRQVEELRQHLQALPVPRRDHFRCACGHQGWVASPVRCTACGTESVHGFYPPGRQP